MKIKLRLCFLIFSLAASVLAGQVRNELFYESGESKPFFYKVSENWIGFSLSPKYPEAKNHLKNLKNIANLKEFRTLYLGGGDVFESVGKINSVESFVAHHGLSKGATNLLKLFPNLTSLKVWGKPTDIGSLPSLKLKELTIEENILSLDDCVKISQKFQHLLFFTCDSDLAPKSVEALKKISSLVKIDSGNIQWEKIIPD